MSYEHLWTPHGHTSNSCNTGMSALPDMYVCTTPERAVPEGKCQCKSAYVATNMLHFRHSKNLPELIANCSGYLYSKE